MNNKMKTCIICNKKPVTPTFDNATNFVYCFDHYSPKFYESPIYKDRLSALLSNVAIERECYRIKNSSIDLKKDKPILDI